MAVTSTVNFSTVMLLDAGRSRADDLGLAL